MQIRKIAFRFAWVRFMVRGKRRYETYSRVTHLSLSKGGDLCLNSWDLSLLPAVSFQENAPQPHPRQGRSEQSLAGDFELMRLSDRLAAHLAIDQPPYAQRVAVFEFIGQGGVRETLVADRARKSEDGLRFQPKSSVHRRSKDKARHAPWRG